MDPNLPFEYDSPDSLFFEQETLVFSIFFIHKFQTPSEIKTKLTSLLKYLQIEFQPYIDHYPWYQAPIQFQIVEERGFHYIYGELVYGDYLNDLWLVTKILQGFTSRDSNIYVRLFDQDGEFLLIEGSDHLDEWMDPISGTNRIWIHDLKFKIIGNDYFPDKGLTLLQALRFIEETPYKFLNPESLNRYLIQKLCSFPEECLKNLFVEEVKVSQLLFDSVLASKPTYVANAAFNFKMKQDSVFAGGFSGSESKLKLEILDQGCFPSVSDPVLQVRVSAFAHLYLKQITQQGEFDEGLEKGKVLVAALDGFLKDVTVEDVNPKIKTWKEFNKITEEDKLQKELIRYLAISKKVESKEVTIEDLDSLKGEKTSGNDLNRDEIMDKLKHFLDSKGDSGGMRDQDEKDVEFTYDSDKYNDDSDYSSDADDVRFNQSIKEKLKGIDIDEDDFFEFFCKDALKLSDEEISNYRNVVNEDEIKLSRKIAELDEDDFADNEIENDRDEEGQQEEDIEAITNLLQSLQTEGGITGPTATLLTQLGLDINKLMNDPEQL
ncbi:unnamed protein product [Ambrosiozyma monospora]|uniref:Unnamed protein product n=1 Tax=Ambrosiozyma monospora TaxID=43982 RepID=A0A9W7DDQ7_AMBMO|nr:unnamed protein product [Ambrosiozyma monospora]